MLDNQRKLTPMINKRRTIPSLVLVLLAVAVFLGLLFTDSIMVMEPIEQSLCPPELAKVEDGTCGIYQRGGMSGIAIAAIVTALLGMIAYVTAVCLPDETPDRKETTER